MSCNMDTMPITVGERPQGPAYEMGVREGWFLCQVGTDPSNMRKLGSAWVGEKLGLFFVKRAVIGWVRAGVGAG